jgi:hypothetical protein
MTYGSIKQERPQDPKVPFHQLRREGEKLVAVRHTKPGHLLQKPPAWSYSVEVIKAMQAVGVDVLEVIYNGKVFSCTLERFLRYARPMDRGFGRQLFLPLQYWDTRQAESEPEPMETIKLERRKLRFEQATLF